MTTQPPDLVLFMTDQQRHDQLGATGATPVRTPNLDRIARDGVTFTNAYSGSTTCVPARTALLTGLLDHRVPHERRFVVERGTWTVPHALRAVGYQTALVGKMHFDPIRADHGFEVMRTCEHLNAYPRPPEEVEELDHYHDWLAARGLPDWRFELDDADPRRYPYATETHPTSWVRDQALDVLRTRDPDRPLFLVVSFPHPHPPLNPPDEYAALYDPDDCDVDPSEADLVRRLPREFQEAMGQEGADQRRVQPDRLDVHRADLARTYALITQVDDAVGAVMAEVAWDDAVVMFTSDHGDYAGHRGLLRKVPWIPFDDLARVPLLAAGGRVAGGRVEDAPVQSFDLAPTLLELAGVEPPGDLDGRSLLGPLTDPGEAVPPERPVFCGLSMGWSMVRRGCHKYIRAPWGAEVLFDLEREPDETFDVKSVPGGAEVLAELSALLDECLAAGVADLPPVGSPG